MKIRSKITQIRKQTQTICHFKKRHNKQMIDRKNGVLHTLTNHVTFSHIIQIPFKWKICIMDNKKKFAQQSIHCAKLLKNSEASMWLNVKINKSNYVCTCNLEGIKRNNSNSIKYN